MTTREVPTVCRMCHGGCGALVTVDGDRAVAVSGHPGNPNNAGFLCAKGRASVEYTYHPDRLRQPLRRTGPRGSGRYRPIGWDGALTEVADRIAAARDRDGPRSVVLAQGTDRNYQEWLFRFANALGTPNVLGPAHVCFYPRVMAGILTLGGFTFCDYEHDPEVVLLWGSNKAATHGDGVIGTRLLSAVSRGTRLIVVDPHRTSLAARAELWLPLRPGTDAALGLGLLHVVLGEGLVDREFIEGHTTGYEQLAEHVRAWDPRRVAGITGVDAELIVRAARRYATAAPAAIELGTGTAQHSNSFDTARSAVLLSAVCGNLDRPGGDVLWDPQAIIGRRSMPMSEALPPESAAQRLGGDRHRVLSMSGWAHPSAVWRAVLEHDPYPVRTMAVLGSNLLVAYPDSERVHRALSALDFLCVADLFLTPTAAMADIVLPVGGWLERDQIVEHANYVAARRAVTSVGESRSDEEILNDLAGRLGLPGFWESARAALDARLAPAGTTWRELADGYYRPTELRHFTYRERGFATPSGRVALYHEGLRRMGHDPMPVHRPPARATRAGEYLLTSRHSTFYFNSEFRNVPSLRAREPDPRVEMHPGTAAAEGIADGDWTLLEAHGSQALFRARVTDAVLPGVLCAGASWWYPELPPDRSWRVSNVNRLLRDGDENPAMGSSNQRGVPCSVRPAPDEVVAACLRGDLAEWAGELR
ncbi:molybdopterin-containing oxidoreductase family protein [Streptomyces spiramenti]|uniref:Molybdopterin-dependent oxidoreductase n=1 Tax=Streptomyces spiramenti TaxID=2720606 RepID=A0ABX1AL30_9ACTN|nr:molybdopterin-dependent oxidoreductase [Streptomyces spiramenti]NJP67808.1 molybdopterin-dependent oxidoreductase [Streptomyces spiramenti]